MEGITNMVLKQINQNTEIKYNHTQVLLEVIKVQAQLEEKNMICGLIKTYAEQDVRIVEIFAKENEKRFEMTAKYIEDRTEINEIALQPRRLFGFERKPNIRAEARQIAIQEGVELYHSLSPTSDPVIHSIIGQRQSVKEQLRHHLANMIENDSFTNKIGFDKIFKMIPHYDED